MTSLQKQLAAIAATSTHQLDLKAQKLAHGKSLLFEPKVAASQDFNTIYQICHEGFQELCMLDARFAPFSKNLFSEQSKVEERTQMTAKENEELNSVLEKFLGLVGARLLLKPAVKAVEWLVRRFRIHEYNTEFTILTFLPYHATPLFPTLLSILPAKIPHTFRFLHPYLSSLANPPRQVIVYTAINTPTFFSALQQYVLKVLKPRHHSSNLLSFWASVTTQAVDGMLDATRSGRANIQRQREEDLLLRILPVLNEGLTFKDVSEVILGCYMIITVLVSKSNLEETVLNSLLEAVVASQSSETLDGCMVCLAVIAQEREESKLPKAVQKILLKICGLIGKLISISGECRVERLALGCALAYVHQLEKEASPATVDRLQQLLESGLMEDRQTTVVLKRLFKTVEHMGTASDLDSNLRSRVSTLITRLDDSPKTSKPLRKLIKDQELDLELLELKLQTTLRAVEEPVAPVVDEDTDMADAPSKDSSALDAAIDSLPSRTTEVSFLAKKDCPLFIQLSQAFLLAAASPADVERFSDLPVLSKDQALTEPTFVTFYARVWSSSFPALARSAALRSVTQLLVSTKEESIDLQALVPYLVCALADSSANVRRAAAECLVEANRLSKASKSAKAKTFGQESLYGPTTADIKWLAAEENSKLLSSLILPSLEECVLDAGHLAQVIDMGLNGPSKSSHTGQKIAIAELKSSLRSSAFAFFASHAIASPVLTMRLRLLSALSSVGKSGSSHRVSILLPAVRQWCSLSAAEAASQCQSETIDLADADRQYFAIIQGREPESVQMLKDIISGDLPVERESVVDAAFICLRAMWSSLKGEVRLATATFLLDLSLRDDSNQIGIDRQANALDILRSVKLSSDILVSFVETVPSATKTPEGPPAAKRRRRSSRAEAARSDLIDPDQAAIVLRRLTLVLELVESSAPENHPELLRGLFRLLDEVQRHATQTKTNLVYLQGLIIGSLLAIVDKLKKDNATGVDTSVIRADLLVDCVRTTENPQVQNSALLLISSLAAWMPELVLHSVMPIFTFMGSSLLRQSDDYSAHVIDQTISRVVPPLAASLRKQNRNVVVGVDKLLLSFTAAFEHIPLHRRLGLFEQLAKTLGPDDSLFAIIAMLVDRYPTDNSVKQFVSALIGTFNPIAALQASRRYLDLVEDAFQPKSRRKISEALFSLDEKDEVQTERTLLNLITSLAELLDDQKLRVRIARVIRGAEADASTLRTTFTSLMEKTIHLSQRLKDRENLYDGCSRVLSSTLKLLPTVELIKSAEVLLENSSDEVRRVALKAVSLQARTVKQGDESSATALLEFLPRINNILRSSADVPLKHSAVTCIDQISEKFGKKNISVVSSSAEVVASKESLGSSDDRLRVMSLLCLASIVEILQDNFIPLLPIVMPKAFAYLDESIRAGGEKSSLHNAVYSLLCALLERISFMFSGNYMETALELSHQSAAAELGPEEDENRLQFYQLAARQLDAKACFSAIERTWTSAIQKGPLATREHLEMLSMAISSRPKSVIIKNTQALYNIFLQAFDLRRLRESQEDIGKFESTDIEELEQIVNEAAIAMTMKLNDATFRPFFVRLSEWAAKGLPSSDARGRMLRSTSFYLFLQIFFDRLKSIVTSYSSYIIEHASEILGDVLAKDDDAQALHKAVLKALFRSFEHDQDDFWQAPSHFTAISAPLLTQLTNPSPTTVTDDVIPTITELAAAAASPDLHKELNAALLKHMRADNASTRLAAVLAEQSLTERLGEDWLALLPEMLPFISELQEDDDENVERETLRWIKRIEEILGESLEGMLQ